MTLKIGVIGTGAIGTEHIRRCMCKLSGVAVTALYDIVGEHACEAARRYAPDARLCKNAEEMINDPEIDAVFITSLGPSHAEYTLAALEAGKYVFCEKPLATTAADCARIIEAERQVGQRRVQVGFMRPYDEGYRDLKHVLKAGTIGAPLMIHAVHRNAVCHPTYTTDMGITDTLIHELDALRWLIDDEYASVRVLFPRRTPFAPAEARDPQLVVIETRGGVLIDVEIFVNCQYGYDIQCAVVGERGEARLPDPASVQVRVNGASRRAVLPSWADRFIAAYDTEIQDFVDGARAGVLRGASAWDGYAAALAADACIRAQTSGGVEFIDIGTCPELYASQEGGGR